MGFPRTPFLTVAENLLLYRQTRAAAHIEPPPFPLGGLLGGSAALLVLPVQEGDDLRPVAGRVGGEGSGTGPLGDAVLHGPLHRGGAVGGELLPRAVAVVLVDGQGQQGPVLLPAVLAVGYVPEGGAEVPTHEPFGAGH